MDKEFTKKEVEEIYKQWEEDVWRVSTPIELKKQREERKWRKKTPIEVNIIEETEKTWERWVKNEGWNPKWTSEQVHIFNRTREPWSEEPGRQGRWGWTRTGKWQRSEEP